MRILVGISGGVDSAFCLLKLINEGHDVEACVLKMHEYTDVTEAREVVSGLGVKLHEVDVTVSFNNIIKKNFASEYLSGRTPNPCVLCNERVKMRALYDYAMERGFEKIATGHYARIIKTEQGCFAVAMAADEAKDQSYMLYRLPQQILASLVLPLSDIDKSEVREKSALSGISVAHKRDSQEICFLPEGNHAEYIESLYGECPRGSFISTDGRILGEHRGIIRYTVGQRKGLGISLGERVFVSAIDPKENTVTLSPTLEGKSEIRLTDVVLSGIGEDTRELSVLAKIRYKSPLYSATVRFHSDGTATVRFDSPVVAAPGQSCVLYLDGYVAAGGIIDA